LCGGRIFSLEGRLQAVFLRFEFGDFRLEVNTFVAFLDALGKWNSPLWIRD